MTEKITNLGTELAMLLRRESWLQEELRNVQRKMHALTQEIRTASHGSLYGARPELSGNADLTDDTAVHAPGVMFDADVSAAQQRLRDAQEPLQGEVQESTYRLTPLAAGTTARMSRPMRCSEWQELVSRPCPELVEHWHTADGVHRSHLRSA